jgi:feruloyl esterase
LCDVQENGVMRRQLGGRRLRLTDDDRRLQEQRPQALLWHGWSDPALSALGSINYYERVQGRDAKSADYFRMFLMPGVLHCFGGPGPDVADWFTAFDEWVDQGKPPDRILARKIFRPFFTIEF